MKINQIALLGLAGLLAAACGDDEVAAAKGSLAVTVQIAADLTDVTTVQISALKADADGNFAPLADTAAADTSAPAGTALATVNVSGTTLAGAVIGDLTAGSYRFVATAYAGAATVAGATASLDTTIVAEGVAIAAFSLGGSTDLVIAGITASNAAPKTSDVVTLTAAVSGNAGGSLLWTDNCDGDFVTNGAASVQWSSAFVDSCTITLTATNPVTSATAILALSVNGQKGALERVVGTGGCYDLNDNIDGDNDSVNVWAPHGWALRGNETASNFPMTKLNGLTLDNAGNLIVPERNAGRVWRWNPTTNAMTRIAGPIDPLRGEGGSSTGDDGPALDATFEYPFDVAVGSTGNIYVNDVWANDVRMIYANSMTIQTVAGNGTGLPYPSGIALDASDNLFVANGYGNDRLQRIYASGQTATTINTEDSWDVEYYGGQLYVSNRFEHAIYKVDGVGTTSYIAGVTDGTVTAGPMGDSGYSGDGGNAIDATLFAPRGLFVDSGGNIFVADGGNGVIRQITPAGTISTAVDVLGTPGDVVVDAARNLYYTDRDSCSVVKVYGPY